MRCCFKTAFLSGQTNEAGVSFPTDLLHDTESAASGGAASGGYDEAELCRVLHAV